MANGSRQERGRERALVKSPRDGMRMAELATRSGVARETIHFYLREGLLPRPRKGGRTVAYYDEEHLERLLTIRRLREEKYLPLAVIKRLLDSPVAAAPSDIDVLAEVLHLGAPLGEAGSVGRSPVPSEESVRVAQKLGLLGPAREQGQGVAAGVATVAAVADADADEGEGDDAGRKPSGAVKAGETAGEVDWAERRVLAVVEDALALRPSARALTLADLSVCAADLTVLVTREAELFFDAVLRSGDVGGSIAALREGRGAVARFITAYRDRMLRRIVDDLLEAIDRGPEVAARAVAAPLSAAKERELGSSSRRERLRAAAARGEREAQVALVWHLFGCGAGAELASLPAGEVALIGEREAVLVAWGRLGASSLEGAVAAVPGFALGQILAGEAALARALRRRDAGSSLLEQAVPALQRLICADPLADPEAPARVFGLFHQGRVEIALPAVLGRTRRGAEALLRALDLCDSTADLDAAASARMKANAHVALGRYRASTGEAGQAAAHFNAAEAIDPDGPIGDVVREERGSSLCMK